MPVFYFLVFIASVMLAGVNILRNRKANSLYVLMSLLIMIHCFGIFMLSVSNTLEVAILSQKILYFGAAFDLPVILLVLVKLCGYELPKPILLILLAMSLVCFGGALSIGYSDIYYKTVELAFTDGYYHLVKVYGPLHMMYPAVLIANGALLILYLITATVKKKAVSKKVTFTLSVLGLGTLFAYLFGRILHSSVNYYAIGLLFLAITMTVMLDRMNMYDMTTNVSSYLDRVMTYAYIAFDKKLRYVSSNDYAKELFPEIKTWRVDMTVVPDDSVIYNEIIKDLGHWVMHQESRIIAIGEKYFNISVRDIKHGGREKTIGYVIEFRDETAEQRYLHAVESYNTKLEEEVKERTADILHIKDQMVLGMASMVESRDNSTGGHIMRTSEVIKVFAERLLKESDNKELTKEFLGLVTKAAPMHDLGKIAVDDAVLRKNGKFTDEEYDKMKAHSQEGAKIVNGILKGVESDDFVAVATNVAYYHHEKWNGMGYPNKLSGEQIPLEARIMALADVFDALVSKRCYKEAFSYDKAFSIIENDLGSHFDKELGIIFLRCRPELERLYNEMEV